MTTGHSKTGSKDSYTQTEKGPSQDTSKPSTPALQSMTLPARLSSPSPVYIPDRFAGLNWYSICSKYHSRSLNQSRLTGLCSSIDLLPSENGNVKVGCLWCFPMKYRSIDGYISLYRCAGVSQQHPRKTASCPGTLSAGGPPSIPAHPARSGWRNGGNPHLILRLFVVTFPHSVTKRYHFKISTSALSHLSLLGCLLKCLLIWSYWNLKR